MTLSKKEGWRKLVVAEKAMTLVVDIYKMIENKLPADERYGLASQLKRSVVSIPSNIVEGYSRGHTKEFIQFLYIARGSAAELEVHVELVERLGFVNSSDIEDITASILELQKMLSKLITSLQAKCSAGSQLNSSLLTLNSK